MSCIIVQHQCDATTIARDLIATLITENEKDMGINADRDKAAYGLYVVPGSKGYVLLSIRELLFCNE